MWDLIVSVPDHCLSFNFKEILIQTYYSGSTDFFFQRKRLKNDTKTVHKRRVLKRHCRFLKRLGIWPMKL